MVVCFKYVVFAVTNIARIRRTISCYCMLGSEDLHPSHHTFKLQMELYKDRNHTFTIIQMYIIIFEEVGIEIAMCCNIQQSTMTFHTRYDTMTSTVIQFCRQNGKCYLFSTAVICMLLYLLLTRRQRCDIRFKTIQEGRR